MEFARYKYGRDVKNLILYGSREEFELEKDNNDRINLLSGYADLRKHLFFRRYPYSMVLWRGYPIFGEKVNGSNDDDFWERFKSVVDGRVDINTH